MYIKSKNDKKVTWKSLTIFGWSKIFMIRTSRNNYKERNKKINKIPLRPTD